MNRLRRKYREEELKLKEKQKKVADEVRLSGGNAHQRFVYQCSSPGHPAALKADIEKVGSWRMGHTSGWSVGIKAAAPVPVVPASFNGLKDYARLWQFRQTMSISKARERVLEGEFRPVNVSPYISSALGAFL